MPWDSPISRKGLVCGWSGGVDDIMPSTRRSVAKIEEEEDDMPSHAGRPTRSSRASGSRAVQFEPDGESGNDDDAEEEQEADAEAMGDDVSTGVGAHRGDFLYAHSHAYMTVTGSLREWP